MTDNELYHFGVKGMKWGVRRKRNITSSNPRTLLKKKKEIEVHDDYKKAHEKKSIASMSDAELRARINRIQMEQQLGKLSPEGVDLGKRYAVNSYKTLTTVAALTGTGLTIYNNIDKISKLLGKSGN